jgi:curved DNA-binding protein CbpA
VSLKDYYGLLEVSPTAPADEVKRAFRQQIAKYHPDKVQHLGKEFQAMAAERAAELTEAYRILCDEKKRAEYDAARAESAPAAPPEAAPAPAAPVEPTASASTTTAAPAPESAPPPPPPPPKVEPAPRGAPFSQERATSAMFVRKAMVGRLRQALDAVASDYEYADVRGFDIACNPKNRLFGRAKGPKLLARYVDRVDGEAIADTWTQAAKAIPSDEVCVLLMGSALAPAGELATAINEQRRRARGAKVTLIPVDARDWDAKMPTDAPPIAKTLIARLRTGA